MNRAEQVNDLLALGAGWGKPDRAWLEGLEPANFDRLAANAAGCQALRRGYIKLITANEANSFTPEYLASCDVVLLLGIATLAAQPQRGAPTASPSNGHAAGRRF